MASSQPGTVSVMGANTGLTAPGASAWTIRPIPVTSVQISLAGIGQVDAVVDVEVSNGPVNAPVALDTPAAVVTLSSASGMSSDGFSISLPWRYIRFRIVSLSGAGATVTGLLGV